MSIEHVEVLVEEPSAEAALRALLPRILGDLSFHVYAHSCKSELMLRLPERLRGYAARRRNDSWFRDHCRIVVVVDRDDSDCTELKASLEAMAREAGLPTRSSAEKNPYALVTRLAMRSWRPGISETGRLYERPIRM